MCGISGIINQSERKVDKEEIRLITDMIKHRGPDAQGFYYGDNFALGFRRLAILDLSAEGNQPMHFDDKYVIVFNGEIYNYIEIREQLIKEGYTFKTGTDTEVILASYDLWKEDCVNHFNGMWSFCLFDKNRKQLFCSRDRYGVKPFYYTVINNQFVFGSEIKQLLPFHKQRFVNKEVLIQFLIGYEEFNIKDTFFAGICKLPPSHNLLYRLNDHTFDINRYYELKVNKEIRQLSEKNALDLIEKEFQRAVKIRLRSDVKVGTCLSGGLDSSTIASYAGTQYNSLKGNRRLTAIHAKSIEEKTDESNFAKIVSENSNLNLKITEPDTDQFFNLIDKVIQIHEEPFSGVSLYMQYFVFEEAKNDGCIVMLDGQGGDEIFLGYERYYLPTLKYLNILGKIRLLRNIRKYTNLNYKQVLGHLLFYNFNFLYVIGTKIRRKVIKRRYLPYKFLQKLKVNMAVYKDINKLQKNELFYTVLPHLLKVEDKNSMYHSVESRLPFVDYKLVETLYSVDNRFKVKNMWTKYLMRKMIENKLPDEIVWRRKKLGFAAPTDIWLNDKERFMPEIRNSTILREVLNEIPTTMDKTTMWKLYNIAVWERIFHVKIDLI